MTLSLRVGLLLAASLMASSVAPAHVRSGAEPLIAVGENEPVADPVAAMPAVLPSTPEVVGDEDEEIEKGATLAETVAMLRSSDPGDRELECLAVGIYYEAKSESLAGQLAVGHVIANRSESGRFPRTYCGVLFQRGQFSFIRGKTLPSVPRASRDWQEAVAIAKIVDEELHPSPMGQALFFHARRVSPGWKLKRVGTLGNHVFYR